MKKVDLLIIDPQEDFCNPNGSLFVPGADQDIDRVADMIERISPKLNDIHVTLDTHHLVDIAHPIFWKDSSGRHPDPFTIISKEDIEDGKWNTTLLQYAERAKAYVTQLEENKRYPLCIWPPHCLIGSDGHKVAPVLFDKLLDWEKGFAMVDYVTKGSNPFTEHYSGVKADVPDPTDPTTQINTPLIRTLEECDIIVLMGWAGSHCLAETALDIANAFGDDSHIEKMVLIEDGTSPVPGFENLQDNFINEMVKRGMKISNTKNFLS